MVHQEDTCQFLHPRAQRPQCHQAHRGSLPRCACGVWGAYSATDGPAVEASVREQRHRMWGRARVPHLAQGDEEARERPQPRYKAACP